MIAVALLLAAQVPATLPPERSMLEAFRTVCDKIDSLDAMKAAALKTGWEEIADSAEPRIERLNRLGREAVGDQGTSSGANFRRTFGERTVFLIASRFEDKSGVWGNGCRLYHFEGEKALDDSVLRRWMKRKPTGVQDLGPTIGRRLLWEPGWRNGLTVEITHVPPGSALKEKFGLSGNVLVAQAIGGF